LTTFAEMNLDRRALEVLTRMEVVEPTPIQEAAIPELMAGRDVVDAGDLHPLAHPADPVAMPAW